MVKNSGKKRRAKRYAAEHGLTYQQAREALDAQHTRDALASLVAERGSTPLPPGQSPTRIPFDPDTDGQMQEAEALPLDAPEDVVNTAIDKALAAYWSIGERGTPDDPSRLWPTSEDHECLGRFLGDPDALIEEHQRSAMVSVKRADGTTLWATLLRPSSGVSDWTPRRLAEALMNPVIADSREALDERMKDLVEEVRSYGMEVQARSPLRRDLNLGAEIEALEREMERVRSQGR